MVFQRSNPFPKSIYDNVAYGPRINRGVPRRELDEVVEVSLKRAALWDEVKDRLRSEEHTSELQSLAYLVCRLLLEKKKNSRNHCYYNLPRFRPPRLLSLARPLCASPLFPTSTPPSRPTPPHPPASLHSALHLWFAA